MPRPASILFCSLAILFVGCASRNVSRREPVKRPAVTRTLRVALPAQIRQAVWHANRAEPLIPFTSPLLDPTLDTGSAPYCRAFDLPSGAGGDADRIVDRWERDLRSDDSPLRFLLAPVQGVDRVLAGAADHLNGLKRTARGISLCSDRPVPDWPARLLHPALWLQPRVDLLDPGPYRRVSHNDLQSNPDRAARPEIGQIAAVDSDSADAGLLIELGEADLAVLYGRAAARLISAAPAEIAISPLADWDVVYHLWVDRYRRWVNDPHFREWLAGSIDREALAEFLFAGYAEPALRLAAADGRGAVWQRRADRPLSVGSRPRLDLLFEEEDSFARSIAERLRLSFAERDVSLEVRGVDRSTLEKTAREGGAALVLMAHRSSSRDPVLALAQAAWRLGSAAEPASALLEQAARHHDAGSRLNAARLAEDALLLHADLIPLVRVTAWLAVDRRLADLEVGAHGALRLERARWDR